MAKYKMADDLDKMKDESLQRRYEKLSKGILYIGVNVAPSTIENLKNSINQLAQQASAAGIMLDIGALKINLEIVEFQVEYNQSKIINETNAKDKKELTEEDKQKIADDRAGRVYKTFDGFHKDFLKKQKEDNKNLDKALENIEKGLDVDEETKKKLKKTPKQIEEEKLRWQHIELTNKIAENRHKYHSESIEKIDQQIAKLDSHHHHTEIAILENQKKHHKHHRDLAETKKTECAEHYHERKEHAQKVCEGLKLSKEKRVNKDIFQDRAAVFHKIHGVTAQEIANKKELHTETLQEKDSIIFPPSEGGSLSLPRSPATSPSQQLDKKQIIPDPDKEGNKIEKRVNNIKQRLGGGKDQPVQLQKTGLVKPVETPPVLKTKESNVGRGGRW